MKLQFTFHFADERKFITIASRQWVAYALRSYRKQPRKYRVHKTAERIGAHTYRITTVGYDAVAIIQPA
jgi:hypothetical protein